MPDLKMNERLLYDDTESEKYDDMVQDFMRIILIRKTIRGEEI